MPCICGLDLNYKDCCGQYIDLAKAAPTAEKLMRSRYTAYVLKKEEYLLATWHPSKRPKKLVLEDDIEWLGLEIIRTIKGLEKDFDGKVEFQAAFKSGDKNHFIKELSSFVKKNGRWFYRDGK